MKPLPLPPVVMALVRCPIVDYFTIVPICRYPEQLSGRATPTLPSWMPPAYLLYTVSLSYALEPARMLRTIFVTDTSPLIYYFFPFFFALLSHSLSHSLYALPLYPVKWSGQFEIFKKSIFFFFVSF